MNLKEQFRALVESVKKRAKERGDKIRNEEIASRLGITRTYLSDLLGEPGKEVSAKHVEDFKAHFREELHGAMLTPKDKKITPERALVLAMLQDYAEWKAAETGQTFDQVKDGIKKKASLILSDPEDWMREVKKG